mmetsp:Transcript_18528/g.39886  ORF Transcript_18528/g.39886 Transcript_18528/m.39886 type:complete len:98 (+) Transcript_18528:121-414(+)
MRPACVAVHDEDTRAPQALRRHLLRLAPPLQKSQPSLVMSNYALNKTERRRLLQMAKQHTSPTNTAVHQDVLDHRKNFQIWPSAPLLHPASKQSPTA